jgi:hypothetical protein
MSLNHSGNFDQDWRDCLRAHYEFVIREGDVENERSLVTVLLQTGFTQNEVNAMRAQIAEAIGLVIIEEQDEQSQPEADVPVESLPQSALPEQAFLIEPVEEKPVEPLKPHRDDPPVKPKQMSLF